MRYLILYLTATFTISIWHYQLETAGAFSSLVVTVIFQGNFDYIRVSIVLYGYLL